MTNGMRLSVATNFEDGFVDALSGYPVAELFGKLPADAIGGGRASFMLGRLSKDRFVRHVGEARARGVSFNYLLNAACLDNAEYTRKWQRDLEKTLDFIESAGADTVTISLPFLLAAVKRRRPSLKVKVGVYARVDNAVKARFWEDMGADAITLESISVNRDLRLLGGIRRAVRIPLQLIVNSNCMMFCPMSGQHMVNLSHASQKGHKSGGFMIDYCAIKCSYEKLADPVNYLRSEFIRPEDLRVYTELGYDSFKVLERGAPTDVMVKRVKAYSEGGYDGNLLDLIQPYGYRTGARGRLARLVDFWRYFLKPSKVNPARLLKLKRLAARRGLIEPLAGEPVHIDNKALDGFLAGIDGRRCGESGCRDCGHCGHYAARAIRVDEGYRTEVLRMYDECFSDLHSGALWRG